MGQKNPAVSYQRDSLIQNLKIEVRPLLKKIISWRLRRCYPLLQKIEGQNDPGS